VSLFDVLRATEYVVPALEVLSSRIEMDGRTIVDTISDNAALGAMVLGGRPVAVDAADLRRVNALLYRSETIEDSGVAAAVLDHRARRRPGRPCGPGRAPAPWRSIPATPYRPTTESGEPSDVVESSSSADLRRACVGPGRGPAPGRAVAARGLARGCRDRRGLGDAA